MFCCNQDNIKDNLLDYNCPVSNVSTKELQSKELSTKTTKYTDCQKPSKEIDQETNVCDQLDCIFYLLSTPLNKTLLGATLQKQPSKIVQRQLKK